MFNLFKKILLTSCLVQLAVSMELPASASSSRTTPILEEDIAEESVVEQQGYYGRLLASSRDSGKSKEELQEEMVTTATAAFAYKKDLINLFMSQLKEATFEYEGTKREKSLSILNFLKYKLENSHLKLESFKDSFTRSEHSKTMKDLGIGKFNCGDEETQRMHALGKSNLYQKILAFIQTTELISFKDNPIITATIADMTKISLENFKGWMVKNKSSEAREIIGKLIYSLETVPDFLKGKRICSGPKDRTPNNCPAEWARTEYVREAKNQFTPEVFSQLIASDPQAYLMTTFPLPSLSESLDKQKLRFDEWLKNHQIKWEKRYLELVKPDNIIENLTLLLSDQAQI